MIFNSVEKNYSHFHTGPKMFKIQRCERFTFLVTCSLSYYTSKLELYIREKKSYEGEAPLIVQTDLENGALVLFLLFNLQSSPGSSLEDLSDTLLALG